MSGDFKVEGDRVTVYVTDNEIYSNAHLFKSHRDYLAYRFKQAGVEVTRWHSHRDLDTGVDHPGLHYMRADSELHTIMEVTATIGVNAKRISE